MWPILSHKNGGWALLHCWALLFSHFLISLFKSCQLSLYGVEEAKGWLLEGIRSCFCFLLFFFNHLHA